MVTDLEFMTQLHFLSKNIIKIIFKDNELSPKLFGETTATNNQTNYQESSTEKTKKTNHEISNICLGYRDIF